MTDLSACHIALGPEWVAIPIHQLMAAAGFLIAAVAVAVWPILSDYVDRNGPPGPDHRMR